MDRFLQNMIHLGSDGRRYVFWIYYFVNSQVDELPNMASSRWIGAFESIVEFETRIEAQNRVLKTIFNVSNVDKHDAIFNATTNQCHMNEIVICHFLSIRFVL